MRYSIAAMAVLLSNSSASAQTAPADLKDQAAVVRYAEGASLRALNFVQGNIPSLVDAQDDFTPQGWIEFMKKLNGWLDDKGAPKFSSNFSPSGKVLDIHQEEGAVRLTIPGILKQESRNEFGGVSSTTYRVEIDIQLGGKPVKIERLEQRTCAGAKTVVSCR
jgi:hypothetical protein